jgi:hypothetical protein
MASDGEKRDEVVKKKRKTALKLENLEAEAGIVYLSRIPTYMGVKHLRHLMSQYGEVGKIFLQPSGNSISNSISNSNKIHMYMQEADT